MADDEVTQPILPITLSFPPNTPFHKVVKSVYDSILAAKQKEVDALFEINREKRKRECQGHLKRIPSPWELSTTSSLQPDLEDSGVLSDDDNSDFVPVAPPLQPPRPLTFTKTWTYPYGDLEDEIVHEGPTVTIPLVKPNPHYSIWSWTPRNYVIADQDVKRHTPYFDEATFTEDTELLNELDTLTNEDEILDIEDEDVFYHTVTTLHDLEKKQRKRSNPLGDDTHWNQMIQETTVVRPSPGPSNFKPAAPEDLFTPSMETFEAVSKVMGCVARPEKLRERFVQLLKKWHPIIKNLHTPGMNLDNDNNLTTSTADKALDSYRQMFCRKCFIYNCPFHIDDGVAPEFITKKVRPELPAPIPCSISCYLHDQIRDGKKQGRSKGDIELGEKEDRRLKWGPNDVSICRVLLNVFKHNYCDVAKIMSTHCRLVERFVATERPKIDLLSGQPMPAVSKSRKQPKVRKPVRTVWPKGVTSHELFLKTVYKPCFHPGMECTPSICTCLESQIPCEKYCTCPPNCVHRAVGCKCEGRCNTRACPCYAAQRECDPDLCCSCGANLYQSEATTCRNIGLQRLWRKHIKLAPSEIPEAGWGIFAVEPILKGELIEEYAGELITDREADRRALAYKKRCHTFLFELNSEYSIDAQQKGSKVRFANHADKPNTHVKIMKVNTDQRIGIYASRDIQPNEEIYLDYKKVIDEHQTIKERKTRRPRRPHPSKTVKRDVECEESEDI